MIVQELIALNEATTAKVKLLVITPGYMGVAAIMPRIIDEFGMNVIRARNSKTEKMIDDVLVVLPKDAKKIADFINGGAFDNKHEKPRAKLAPAIYYSNVDLDDAFDGLIDKENYRKKNNV